MCILGRWSDATKLGPPGKAACAGSCEEVMAGVYCDINEVCTMELR